MLQPRAVSVRAGEHGELETFLAAQGLQAHVLALVHNALAHGQCFVAAEADDIKGVVTYHSHFFGCALIEFLLVVPQVRRLGIATKLIHAVEQRVGAGKLFTSTNQSNLIAQRLFEQVGFTHSGVVENLDPGDPELIYFKWIGGHPK